MQPAPPACPSLRKVLELGPGPPLELTCPYTGIKEKTGEPGPLQADWTIFGGGGQTSDPVSLGTWAHCLSQHLPPNPLS